METFMREHDEVAPLGMVFFCNNFVRALDEFRVKGSRPERLAAMCDEAISSLYAFQGGDPGRTSVSSLVSSPEEIATLASSIERHFKVKTTQEASKRIEGIQKALSRVKTQKDVSEELRHKIKEIVEFFECLAEEGLANCSMKASGDMTEAQRVWQRYAMS